MKNLEEIKATIAPFVKKCNVFWDEESGNWALAKKLIHKPKKSGHEKD